VPKKNDKWHNKFISQTAISIFFQLQTTTVFEFCLIKLLLHILFEKYIYFLALEMANPGNQHCANCIGTLSSAISPTTLPAEPMF